LLVMFWGSSLPSSSGLSKNCMKMEAANSIWKSLITNLHGFTATRLWISGKNLVSQLIPYNRVFASMPDYNLSYRETNEKGRGQIMFHPPQCFVLGLQICEYPIQNRNGTYSIYNHLTST
jgi:hypothetical protein